MIITFLTLLIGINIDWDIKIVLITSQSCQITTRNDIQFSVSHIIKTIENSNNVYKVGVILGENNTTNFNKLNNILEFDEIVISQLWGYSHWYYMTKYPSINTVPQLLVFVNDKQQNNDVKLIYRLVGMKSINEFAETVGSIRFDLLKHY